MEILLTLEASTDWTMYDSTECPAGQDRFIPYGLGGNYRDQESKDADFDEFANVLSPLGTSLPGRNPLSARTSYNESLSVRHFRSLSSGCDFKRALGMYSNMGRLSHQNSDMSRARR